MSNVKFTVTIDGKERYIAPGDSIDCGSTMIIWLDEEDTVIHRLQLQKRQRESRGTIEFVRQKTIREMKEKLNGT